MNIIHWQFATASNITYLQLLFAHANNASLLNTFFLRTQFVKRSYGTDIQKVRSAFGVDHFNIATRSLQRLKWQGIDFNQIQIRKIFE